MLPAETFPDTFGLFCLALGSAFGVVPRPVFLFRSRRRVRRWGGLVGGSRFRCRVGGGWWELDPTVFGTAASLDGALAAIELPVWALLIITVAGGTFLPFLLSFLAIRRLRPTAAGIIASSEVVFAFAVAWLWLGEALDWVQLIGASIVLAGIVLAQVSRPGTIADPNLAVATGAVEIITGSIRVIPDESLPGQPPRRDSNSRHDG